ncbi:radical SAM family heme chaperone HemW [Kineosporia sp. NBRC 101731]|uniref:radical SAM family heme chaperone HemW n=1 Tax=Kineosporia sp. NBRC 101731 TaxID=3032199 RepID=UPI0024A1D129|nr:radical SAM family heme chaperone HemW [Kineosporia sp. NBRC 101731]GLY30464.1 coproporphyrinogen III oxidase [Kineosporia sp. NBRC 101731]
MIIRRNIHTYPFKYQYVDYDEYFRPESAVLYLHVPFCLQKCGFCDYTVYINRGAEVREKYVQALEKEIRTYPQHGVFPRFNVDAIYFGGGTPGLLEGEQLARLLTACRETFEVNADAEICLEFDPPTVTAEKVETIQEAGFNRISLGIQAFDDELLRICNRSHDVATAERAYKIIKDAGYSHINLDLIFPLPNLTMDSWRRAVDRGIELEPSCLTTYGLEIWPNTAFHHQIINDKLTLPTPDEELAMYSYALDQLEGNGFQRVSSTGYFHPDRGPGYSKFLEYYWRTWPMLGFGVSSKSVVHNRLYTNVKGLKQYHELIDQGRIPLDFATYLTKKQEMRRVVIRGLKMCEVSRTDFIDRFGVDIDSVFGTEMAECFDEGLLENIEDLIVLTRKGQLHSTNVYEKFYAEDDLTPPAPGEVRFGISELVH